MRRFVLIALVTLAACGDGSGSGNDLVGRGQNLYLANCAQCHGFDLKGTNTGPSLLSIVYEPGHHSDEAFWLAVSRGVQPHHWDYGPMPPIPSLTRTDVQTIVAFVRDQQEQQGFEPYPP
jgi:mono/diheme cytochrome c family protein